MFSQLKETIRLDPNHIDALNYLGYTYSVKNINLDEALELIEKAIKLAPDRGYIRDSLGWVYFKKGRYDDALREIKKAVEMTDDDPVIYEHLGDVYLELNNKKATIDAWEKSLKFHEKEEGLKERVEEKIERLRHGKAEMR